MSINITQEPFDEGLTVSNAINMVVASSTNSGNPKFKFVFDLYINGNRVVRIRRTPNPSSFGMLSFNEIARRFCKPTHINNDDSPIDYTPQLTGDDIWSKNRNTVKYIKIEVGEEYAASSTAKPEVQAGSFVDIYGYVLLGAQQFLDGQIFPTSDYRLQSSPDTRFLTVVGNSTQYVRNNDWGVLAYMQFTNGQNVYGIDINYFDRNGNPLGGDNEDVSGTGMSSYTTISLSSEDSAIKFFAAFPENLKKAFPNSESNPDHPANTGWSYYELTLTNINGDPITQTMRFKKTDCLPFKKFRLKFLNNLGCWDYFNFNIGHSETIDITREQYQSLYGSWSGGAYNYDFYERGKTNSDVVSIKQYQINTEQVPESYSEFFRQLFASREVYLLENDNVIPVVITDNSKRIKNGLEGDVIRYQATVELVHEIKSA